MKGSSKPLLKYMEGYLYFYEHIKGLDITADELFDVSECHLPLCVLDQQQC